ncbi:hypothetical protein [Delftia acidovorans]|uniref:hypothetical protein n=1 Tax=Delftia acidovorans TaxID=80866 RepID=UPI002FCD6355
MLLLDEIVLRLTRHDFDFGLAELSRHREQRGEFLIYGQPAALAGLYSEWTDPETGELVPNYTMITQLADGHPVLSLMHRPGKEKRREEW